MKVTTKHIYTCQICKKEFNNELDCKLNEAKCLGLTIEEYEELCFLLKEERETSMYLSTYKNRESLEAQDKAIKNVIKFLREHNLNDDIALDFV